MSFADCFPCSDLVGVETKVVVCYGEVERDIPTTVEIQSLPREKMEGYLFAACRLVPLPAASFVFASSSLEVR